MGGRLGGCWGGGGVGKGGLTFSSERDVAEPIKKNSAVFDNYICKMPTWQATRKRGAIETLWERVACVGG